MGSGVATGRAANDSDLVKAARAAYVTAGERKLSQCAPNNLDQVLGYLEGQSDWRRAEVSVIMRGISRRDMRKGFVEQADDVLAVKTESMFDTVGVEGPVREVAVWLEAHREAIALHGGVLTFECE